MKQTEREEHEATQMPFRDWCTHCMMEHKPHSSPRVEEKESRLVEETNNRDGLLFSQVKFHCDSQTIPDESVTCIAVEEDRHQNIMSSVVLKKGIEEPWASERVGRFIDSSGYKEITLKRDTEPAIIAFRNRVAEICNTEVTSEDAVKRDKPSGGLVENAVMLLRGVISTIKCHVGSCKQEELQRLPDFGVVGGNMRGAFH